MYAIIKQHKGDLEMSMTRVDWTDNEMAMLRFCGVSDIMFENLSAQNVYEQAALNLFIRGDVDSWQALAMQDFIKKLARGDDFRSDVDHYIEFWDNT